MNRRPVLVCTPIISAALAAAEPSLRADVTPTSPRTVDTVTLTLRATGFAGPAPTLDPPPTPALEAAGWTVTAVDTLPPALGSPADASLSYAWRLTLEPFLDGDYTIPALTAVSESGERATSQPITIAVAPVLAEPPDETVETAADLAEPLDALRPAPTVNWLVITAAAAGGAALIGATAFALTRRRGADPLEPIRRRVADPQADPAPALREALAATVEPRASAMTAEELAASTYPAAARDVVRAILAVEAHRYARAPLDTGVIAAGRAAAQLLLRGPHHPGSPGSPRSPSSPGSVEATP